MRILDTIDSVRKAVDGSMEWVIVKVLTPLFVAFFPPVED